ncbi:hypothetical protein CES85_2980 (plasmid) [Ochrobactrum quorumnocens]|uniref:Uncharacterized protein n=1 Tax=Ochrobactrum quorumnocens TaxID=271865 RepID=A0A248ULZ4_9HYPH|nr:hypothetical protein CES85_2980 [[Ochrobactrum] quorumnocens]
MRFSWRDRLGFKLEATLKGRDWDAFLSRKHENDRIKIIPS